MSNQSDQNHEQALHELYQSMPKDMPPPELDARILQAAQQAVTEQKSNLLNLRRKPSRSVWIKSLAYAAVLVLCLGIVLRIQVDAPESIVPQSAAPDSVVDEAATAVMAPLSSPHTLAEPSAAMSEKPVQNVTRAEAEFKTQPAEMEQHLLREQTQKKALPESVNRRAEMPARSSSELQQPAMSVRDDAAGVAAPAPVVTSVAPAGMAVHSAAIEDEVAVLMQLYQAEKFDQLKGPLQTFIASHPDYELPPELQSFAKQNKLD